MSNIFFNIQNKFIYSAILNLITNLATPFLINPCQYGLSELLRGAKTPVPFQRGLGISSAINEVSDSKK